MAGRRRFDDLDGKVAVVTGRAAGLGLGIISSVAGRVAPAGFAAYAATKWGLNG